MEFLLWIVVVGAVGGGIAYVEKRGGFKAVLGLGGGGAKALPSSSSSSSSRAPDRGLVPNVPVTMPADRAAEHKAQRPMMIAGFTKALGRAPNLAELQYGQAIAYLETEYGNGWKGPMVGSNNYGAVQCPQSSQASSSSSPSSSSAPSSASPSSSAAQSAIDALRASINAIGVDENGKATDPANQPALDKLLAALAKATAALSSPSSDVPAPSASNLPATIADVPGMAPASAADVVAVKKAEADPSNDFSGVRSRASALHAMIAEAMPTARDLYGLNAKIAAARAGMLGEACERYNRMCDAGATMAGAPDCVTYQDSNPDGSKYPVSFVKYATPQDGIAGLGAEVFTHRPGTVRALESDTPSVFRASLAMRREKYYGGFCPVATKQYGADAAKESFGTPDKDAGTMACQAEAVTAHANRASQIIGEIATACGDTMRMPLGDLDAAIKWWKANPNA